MVVLLYIHSQNRKDGWSIHAIVVYLRTSYIRYEIHSDSGVYRFVHFGLERFSAFFFSSFFSHILGYVKILPGFSTDLFLTHLFQIFHVLILNNFPTPLEFRFSYLFRLKKFYRIKNIVDFGKNKALFAKYSVWRTK